MILRIILVSLRNLIRQPFRTILILQGVIWGTAIGVFPPAVINGSKRLVEDKASQLGSDRVLLTQDKVEAARPFDWALIDSLRRDGGTIKHVCGLNFPPNEARALATDRDALAARGMELAAGRFFTAAELRAEALVCVVEAKAAKEIWGDTTPLGQRFTLDDGRALEVIGVTAPRHTEDGEPPDELGYRKDHPMRKLVEEMKLYVGVFQDKLLDALSGDAAVMVPHTLFPDLPPRWIEMRAEPKEVLRLRDRLQSQLASDGYEPILYVNAILPILFGETVKTIIELDRAIFVLSIFVGTSVVCSIMVLSVVERQREIAIRRVEGARRWHIALQFIVETGTQCTVGAVLGLPLGIALAMLRCAIEPLGSVSWVFPTAEVCVLVPIVTAIGLAGGLLPAWRAMRVDPVEMLRYE